MLQGFSKTMMTGAALLCLIAVTNTAKADAAACPATIPFGLTTPLTGNLALLGTQARNGAEFAVDEINAAGGISGKKIALTTEDTGASSTDALNAMNRIIESKPLVIMSSMISPHVFAQTESVNKSETPFIVGATNAKVTAQGSRWLFRTHAHDGQLADLIPEYLVKSLKKTKPGILVVADDYGLGASKGIQAALAKLNVTPAATASYAPSDKDMSAQLLEIKDKGADSLILFGRPSDITLVLKQMGDLGIKLTTIGNTSIVAQTTLNNLSAAEADGNYAIGGMIPQTSTDPKILDWAKRVQDKYKVPADNFTVSYYDSVFMLKSIIEKVGCDKPAIRDALAATKDFKGMLISYQADANGDLTHTLGIYRNKGKTPEFTGPIKESGF
ncbi:ABC transporter substrate-binding protein [Tardiphaga sp. OK245]|uniref:ABC transporter substrate-binding protein n=1 Tax=Tardiphaga sp. OK245 TaxID=1855306 RepID=UPI0008A80427|nr:ABC transporter substrate-binding protein [Tardiphaga sp. OK245]SEI17063.1 ABC-type branched-chain amino acid transport system, substrate-binding protein [Tardiphaga sp. OK245]